MNSEKFKVDPGDVVINEPGSIHGLWNKGKTAMKLVVVEISQEIE